MSKWLGKTIIYSGKINPRVEFYILPYHALKKSSDQRSSKSVHLWPTVAELLFPEDLTYSVTLSHHYFQKSQLIRR